MQDIHAENIVRHILALSVIFLVAGGAIVVLADEPPLEPAAYYGTVSVNDEPAPPGVTIEAELGGEVVGSITVDEEGTYGGSALTDDKLQVNGTEEDEGNPVTFYVDGFDFDRTEVETDPAEVTWESGDMAEVNLSATVEQIEQPTLSNLTVGDSDIGGFVLPGETDAVSVDATNPLEDAVTFNLTATFDPEDTDGAETEVTEQVELDAAETAPVTFALPDDIAVGQYNVTVGEGEETLTASLTVSVDPTGNDNPATDTTGDGLLDDLTGDGSLTIVDVQALFDALDNPAITDNPERFQFAGLDSETVSIFDVQALFNQISE